MWCAQKDILDKAARCIVEYYRPVDGTSACGPQVSLKVLDLDGNVSLVPVFLRSVVMLAKM